MAGRAEQRRDPETGLTPAQARFVDAMLTMEHPSPNAAARAAGCRTKKAAEKAAERWMADPAVVRALAERRKARAARVQIDEDYLLTVLHETVERCRQVAPVLDRAGNQVMVETRDGSLAPAFTFDAKNVIAGVKAISEHLGIGADQKANKELAAALASIAEQMDRVGKTASTRAPIRPSDPETGG